MEGTLQILVLWRGNIRALGSHLAWAAGAPTATLAMAATLRPMRTGPGPVLADLGRM